jgi:hypothetical protein
MRKILLHSCCVLAAFNDVKGRQTKMAVPGGIPRGVPGDLNITTPAPGRQFNCTEDMKVGKI